MIQTEIIELTKANGTTAYIKAEPEYENDGQGQYFNNAYQLYTTDEAGHLHFTTMGISPEIGENTPVQKDVDNADHIGHLTFDQYTEPQWKYFGEYLTDDEREQLIAHLQAKGDVS
ncbi:hypothetical protein [Mucilaginibacter myungsuensis]|uniref:Uncharacterized protein n=2 Tax=Mucilaginibacter myungsuensis TaxID=649104 RepID=A0A929KYC9_9SPHI|nr:hypothetical protein [Mucilaginibacter myungsuensis]MBE9663417.1 hypothetical protein [Mucilaginibacter myungsuensis]MDN3600153.1 hypothetical protein [Mucilaginibacter myungsuensis]